MRVTYLGRRWSPGSAIIKSQRPSLWDRAQPAFVGEQGKQVFDADFDIDDGGLAARNDGAAGQLKAWRPGRPHEVLGLTVEGET
jgi:hypothetical protein